MKTRRREPLPGKGCKLIYDSNARAVALPPPFSVTGVELVRAVRREVGRGGLMQAEAEAIARMVDVICSPIPPSEIVASFRRAFEALACSTTPDRAWDLAMWTPFDPDRLEDECERCRARRAA